ncbi:NAD(P)-dependent dehydrogenase, short-chain alcohol dehydrogenase family [Nakamurella panacisegetis]|uniref:NAD(P)-dependent dehydrogenase, short-chain alcohol dehydrogenase family n=1 Tax=Nakamurella panacisegetis TaxID=1090615 RepID=A0A1H0KU92_9ACTN|nr:SDR family NAD(P)-dependent oxidoreductase [Nakamurella panacisegetis]SDO59356.1 NAD(P)-dependent dehydrogenase, short-chain alcohol dehydrogenase family [Nakamurella panacisegetis]
MTIHGALDELLDVMVIPGYSSIGPALRKHWWPGDPRPFTGHPDIVVTGGGSGLGEAAALGLARLGARVHLVGRKAARLQAAADRMVTAVPDAQVITHEADISDLDSVASLAAELERSVPSLHALIHCAGLIPPERTLSAQGHELTFATHVLGPFALTVRLRTLLRADGDGRVIWVSSGGMYSSPLVSDLEFASGDYKGVRAYARTKRMQVSIAAMLGAAFDRDGDPVVHSMHPGWADTPGVTDSIPGFAKLVRPILRTAEQGADTIVWLSAAGEPATTTGQFFSDRRVRPTYYLRWKHDRPAVRRRLWLACEDALVASGFGEPII